MKTIPFEHIFDELLIMIMEHLLWTLEVRRENK